MRPLNAARIQVVLAALFFSTGGAAIKACAMDSWQVAGFRSGVAGLFFLTFLPATRQRWTWMTLLVGAIYGGTMISFVTATKLTTSANAIFLQSTHPLWVLLLAPWLLREKLRPRDLACLALMGAGIGVLFFGPRFWPALGPPGGASPAPTASNPELGDLIAIVSGILWAGTVVSFRWLARGGGEPYPAVLAGNAVTFFACLPFVLPVPQTTVTPWLWILFLGVVQIGFAYIFMTRALTRVPALEAALLLLVEPVFNPVWAWLMHGEVPSRASLLGGLLILAATLVLAIRESSRREAQRLATPADQGAG